MADSTNGQSNGHRPPQLHATTTFTFPPREQQPRQSPSPLPSHRQSISDQLRGIPSSPRSSRHASLSQQAFQELLNNPPVPHKSDNPFRGRDWKTIKVSEVINPQEVHWNEWDSTVEAASKNLVSSGAPNVVLIREHAGSREAVATFDYSDLNAFLLLSTGVTRHEHPPELIRKVKAGESLTLSEIQGIGSREAFVSLPHTAGLADAVEIFGSGVHRIIILHEGTRDVLGVMSQLRLVAFFWDYGRAFPAIEPLFVQSLKEIGIGSRSVRSINGDRPLIEALELMHRESITSLPVLDNSHNVVGNISHVDVRLLTTSASLPLLRATCIHFISVILSERGVHDGKDSYPVFYIQPYSTLAHTIAKLVATRSHRMWIVDSPSPAGSTPPTPSFPPATSAVLAPPTSSANPTLSGPPFTSTNAPSVSASALPGQAMSGRLSGVVSLTDILNLVARASGLDPRDPDEARRLRRRSSSSSVRSSVDLSRSSASISQR